MITVAVTCVHRASPHSGSKSVTPRGPQPNPSQRNAEDQLKYLSEWAVREHLDFVRKEKQASHRHCLLYLGFAFCFALHLFPVGMENSEYKGGKLSHLPNI